MPLPKAILFDIGGVCVISPMQAIYDYEVKHGIPENYINFAISQSSPNGAWHKLERGEVKMDDAFFAEFKSDLHRPDLWEKYHAVFKNRKRTLAESAKANATQLGDPVSLKAETSSRVPTPEEAGASPSVSLATNARSSGGSGLKESYQKNMLGDPTSLKNEGSASEPVGMEDQATGYSKGGESDGARGIGGSGRQESSLQQSYKKNMLGDPTSLKNEGGSSNPLPDQADTGYSKDESAGGGNSLKASYKRNMLGDPTSLENETAASGTTLTKRNTAQWSARASPTSSSKGDNSLKQSYQKNMLGDPTSLKNEGSSSSPLPDQADTGYSKPTTTIPPLPTMDTTAVFWEMMRVSRTPDPHMLPALLNLKQSKKFIVGALSNTVIFPPDHPYSQVKPDDPNDVRAHFDIFVSSAHIGLRKPDPAIYRVAIDMLDKFDRGRGGTGVTAEQVCFLDDIGQNLSAARKVGLQTIKVNLGRVDEAVRELEEVTGLKLAGDKAKL